MIGIVPALRIFSRILQYESGQGKEWLKIGTAVQETLRGYFGCLYTDYGKRSLAELTNLRRARIGEAGFGESEDEMTNIIQFNHQPEFPHRQPLSDVARAAHQVAYEMYQINRKGISSGKVKKGWVFANFDFQVFRRTFHTLGFGPDSFGSVATVLYKTLIEESGGKKAEEGSRLAQLLGLVNIIDNPTIRMLDNLRNYWDHALRVLDSEKKLDVISSLKTLTGKNELAHPNELSSDDFRKAVLNLLTAISCDVLRPALEQLG